MHRPDLSAETVHPAAPRPGFVHIAFVVGVEADVDALSRRLANDGFRVLEGPRRTGDGYYESVVLDPEGNRIELTAAAKE
jgi:lactoylglutathione lyase